MDPLSVLIGIAILVEIIALPLYSSDLEDTVRYFEKLAKNEKIWNPEYRPIPDPQQTRIF